MIRISLILVSIIVGFIPQKAWTQSYPCSGSSIAVFDFNLPLTTNYTLFSLDTGIPDAWTGLSHGWQQIQDTQDTLNTIMAVPSWYTDTIPANNWLILPSVNIQNQTCFSFWAKSVDPDNMETLEIGYFPASGDTSIYQPIDTIIGVDPYGYHYSYDLSFLDGQAVRIVFKQTSLNKFILYLDEVHFTVAPLKDVSLDRAGLNRKPARGDSTLQVWVEVRNRGIIEQDTVYLVWHEPITNQSGAHLFDSLGLKINQSKWLQIPVDWIATDLGTFSFTVWKEPIPALKDDSIFNDTLVFVEQIDWSVSAENLTSLSTIKIYPNPVQDYLEVASIGEWELTDIQGSVLARGYADANKCRIDFNQYPVGIYIFSQAGQHIRIIKAHP